eukprot:c17156_g2_i3.p1 GENE.c17156_g2_i3~~c17156_g2_i3.p1  ORF type:complete len:629 (+),score=147.69 c17156_g2_i3:158-2044(+)
MAAENEAEIKDLLAKIQTNTGDDKGRRANDIFELVWVSYKINRTNQNFFLTNPGLEILIRVTTPENTDYTRDRGFNTLGTLAFKNDEVAKRQLDYDELLESVRQALSDDERSHQVRERAAYLVSNITACMHQPRPEVMFDYFLPIMLNTLNNDYSSTKTRGICMTFVNALAGEEDRKHVLLQSNVVGPLTKIMRSEPGSLVDFQYIPLAAQAVAQLVGEEEANEAFAPGPHTDKVMRLVIQSLEYATQNAPFPGTVFYPTVFNSMRGLVALCVSDRNKPPLIRAGAVQQILRTLLHSDRAGGETNYGDETLNYILKTLWQLSFDASAREIIQLDIAAVEVLAKFREGSVTVTAKQKESAAGILFEIENAKNLGGNLGRSGEGKGGPNGVTQLRRNGHVMLSYCWSDHEIVFKIRDALVAEGYAVRCDSNRIGSGVGLEGIVDAIESSAVMLVGVSDGYKKNSLCRSEAEFAFRKKVPIFPLLLQSRYEADGWLGLLTGTKLCFDFTTNFQNTFHALIRDLGDRGKLTSQISNPDSWMQDAFTTAPPTKPTADQLPSFSNWSVSRVGSWVVSIGLPHLATKLIELRVDGQCLLALRAYSAKELDEFVRAEFDLDLADTLKFRLNLSNLE